MSKRKKAPTPPKKYKGFMKFPLYGAETEKEFYAMCEYGGDFALPHKRRQIFNRPRKFKVEIWLKVWGENAYEISELTTPNDLLDKTMLQQLMFQYAVADIKEMAQREDINIDDSYFKVIL